MTLDEALEKVVIGYFARHDGMAPNAHIYYEFQGYRLGFNHDGRVGSSSAWHWEEADEKANWYVTNAAIPIAWGDFQTVRWDIEAAVDVPDTQLEEWGEVDYPGVATEQPVSEGWTNYGSN